MKRLALFLVGALAVFELSYALEDPRMFFGTTEPAPVAGQSDRPAVEEALARLDAALSRFYAEGDEEPLRSVLASPDAEESPLHAWRLDRHAWVARGAVAVPSLEDRRVGEVSVFGVDTVSATTAERWQTRLDGGDVAAGAVVVRYRFRRLPGGLRVETIEVQP